MAEELISAEEHSVPLFNSSLETGVRTVVILDAAFPRSFDLAHLTWFDHLVVHTADIGGPESLHPDIPQRTGELLVRRRLVDEGVGLMRRLHLVDAQVTSEGVSYQAREEAAAFVDSLRSNYARALKARASWLCAYLKTISDDAVSALITERIGRWAVEFQGETGLLGSSP